MKTIIIDKKIKLVEDWTIVEVTVICPEKNIQTMLSETGAKLVSKEKTVLPYNHHAGIIYEVEISAMFSKVEKHLKTVSIYEAENIESYIDLININLRSYKSTHCYKNEITGIYEFGNCYNYEPSICATPYYYKNRAKPIWLNNTMRTNFGHKRYVKNNEKWASNRKF